MFTWEKRDNFKRTIQNWIGIWLLRFARYFIGRGLKRCWICGCNPGMGLITRQGHWCWDCRKKWERYDDPRNGIVVDWKGLGRHVK